MSNCWWNPAAVTISEGNGRAVYDLAPGSDENWRVTGPAGHDPKTISPYDLPDGFKYLGTLPEPTIVEPCPGDVP